MPRATPAGRGEARICAPALRTPICTPNFSPVFPTLLGASSILIPLSSAVLGSLVAPGPCGESTTSQSASLGLSSNVLASPSGLCYKTSLSLQPGHGGARPGLELSLGKLPTASHILT